MSRAASGNILWRAIAITLGIALGMTVIAVVDADTSTATGSDDAVAAQPVAASIAVPVTLTEFAISPDPLVVPPGDVTLAVANTGVIQHDLTIEGLDVATATLNPGDTEEIALTGLEPGEYRIICSVQGHADSGMTATLVVDPDADTGAVADATEHAAHDAAGTDDDRMTPDEMAMLHEQGVIDFPVETQGQGGQPYEPEILPDGTKRFVLVADEITWETEPGTFMEGLAYNEQIPGPEIRVQLGDRVQIELINEMDEPTAMHSHGLIVPNEMDGVPGLNQPSIMPGESFTYEFTVRNSGTHMYHSHFNSADQVTRGLLGAFIVEDPEIDPEVDLDYTMVLNDGPLGYTLNGKGFPATEPIVVKLGDRIRIRYMNEGLQIHPMHLHGIPQQVIAIDGWMLDVPFMLDTVLVAPGQRVDVLVDATEPGGWAFHCHILNHAEGPHGMFGMVTAMVVEDA